MADKLNGQGLPVRQISKMMAIHDTLVYDSDNWSTY